jgi:RNA polymerase primary sigma factor
MDNKIVFREMLSEIKEAAGASNDVISKEEIREILGNLPLEEEHFQLIYSYLAEQNIRVVETKEEVQEASVGDEQQSLSIYIDEVLGLNEELTEDEQQIMHLAMQGDETARQHLIESYLPMICEIASGYEGTEVTAEDLIQEGNLGLLTAMEVIGRLESPAACRAHIINSINKAMEEAIGSSRETQKKDEGIVKRVNHLNEAVQNLERDLEHKVSAEELSAYLEMPLEEIRDILRMSGDQIEIEGN